MTQGGFADEPDVSRLVDRRMALTREWDERVEQVRRLPGFEDFLKPPPLPKLLPASDAGPVAMINVSRWGCDALLIVEREVRVCHLGALTAEDVEIKTKAYLTALEAVSRTRALWWKAVEPREGVEAVALAEAEDDAEELLRVILRWLWRTIAKPVLDTLGLTSTPTGDVSGWPRLWWCPTGRLTLLPLHAAGDHLADGPDRPTVLDRVVSSYTPTLRALIQAREPLPEDPEPRLLVVTVPQVRDEAPLPEVITEREMLIGRFPGRHTLAVTGAEVVEQLSAHRWVHFSCHGDQKLDNPSRGGLWLADGLLSIAELSAQQYQGEFAFLSACKTATGGVELADEAITLAAALHYTGYRHVIGTLWTVFDATAAKVADAVYAPPFDPAGSVFRLHEVLMDLRDSQPLSVWTPFSHLGP